MAIVFELEIYEDVSVVGAGCGATSCFVGMRCVEGDHGWQCHGWEDRLRGRF